jgi:hypothetical protein
MKRTLLTLGLLVGLGIGGSAWVSAQTAPAPKGQTHDHAAAAKGASPAPGGMMGGGSMCGGMGTGMGMGMGGGGMAMGGMPMGAMMGADARVEVKNVDKGVTITITSTDPAKVKRLQKMAEAMRLMHEANVP